MRALLAAIVLGLFPGCSLETTPLFGSPARDRNGGVDGGSDGGGDADADGDGDSDGDADSDSDADGDGDADADGDGDADPPVCGDSVVEGGEVCDQGPGNAHVPAYRVTHGANGFDARPILRSESSVSFYDIGQSCHSNTGYEADGRIAFMVYQESDTGQRSLVLILGGDFRGNNGSADVDIQGFEADPVLLSDDIWECNGAGDELFWAGQGLVAGRFGWGDGMGDGGVVRLDCPLSLTITVDPGWNIDTLVWIDGDGTVKDIGFGDPILFECKVDPPACRDDCTPPTCGDGFLDPGEECDDGNLDDRDGCPNDCDV